jgi:hypothetical protein
MLKFNSITFMQFRDYSIYKNLKVNTNRMIVTLIINYNYKTSSLLHDPTETWSLILVVFIHWLLILN